MNKHFLINKKILCISVDVLENVNFTDFYFKSSISSLWELSIAFTVRYENLKNFLNKDCNVSFSLDNDIDNLHHISGIITLQKNTVIQEDSEDDLVSVKIKILPKLYLLSKIFINCVFNDLKISEIIKKIISNHIDDYEININCDICITINNFNDNYLNFLNRIFYYIGIFYFYDFENNKWVFSDDINFYISADYEDKHFIHIETEYCTGVSINKVRVREKFNTLIESAEKENDDFLFNEEYQFFYSFIIDDASMRDLLMSNFKDKNNLSYKNKYVLSNIVINNLFIFSGNIILNSKTLVHCTEIKYSLVDDIKEFTIYSCNIKIVVPEYKKCDFSNKVFTGTVIGDANVPKIDEDGLIHVKLHSDFIEDKETSYVKARMSYVYAGSKYGMHFIPRGGHEVLLVFLDNLHTYPVIIGSLYNTDLTEHYQDQNNLNCFYIRSETVGKEGVKNSDDEFANEFFMDDSDGNELVRIGARLKCEFHVTKFLSMIVGKKGEIKIYETIIQTYSIDHTNDKFLNLKSESMSLDIQQSYELNAETIKIKSTQDTDCDAMNYKIKSTADTEISCINLKVNASASIELTCGASKIKISPASISIESSSIKINSIGNVDMDGSLINITGKGVVNLSSASAMFDIKSLTMQSPVLMIMGGTNTIMGITTFV